MTEVRPKEKENMRDSIENPQEHKYQFILSIVFLREKALKPFLGSIRNK